MKFKSKDEALTARKSVGDSQEVAQKWVDENCGDLPDTTPVPVVKLESVEKFTTETKEDIAGLQTLVEELTDKLNKSEIKNVERDATMKDLNGSTAHPRYEVHEKELHEMDFGFKCFADFAYEVKENKDKNNPNLSQRMSDYREKATGLFESSDSDGGFTVPTIFSNQLFKLGVDQTSIMSRSTKMPMTTNAIEIPYVDGFDRSGNTVHGGVQFKWVEAGQQQTGTKPKFGQLTLKLKDLMGLVFTTNQLLEDSAISMEPLFNEMFTDALAFALDDAFINGTGAGKPQGILNSSAKITQDAEGSQAAKTIVYENIIKMYSRQWRPSRGVWIANHDVLPALLVMGLKVGTGGSAVYLPNGGENNAAAGAPPGTLMGLPIEFSEHCQTLGTEGDIILGDYSQYLVGQKTGAGAGMRSDSSMHLKFDFNEVAFRFTTRIDAQSWWSTFYTPAKSAVTLSPFVTLETRP